MAKICIKLSLLFLLPKDVAAQQAAAQQAAAAAAAQQAAADAAAQQAAADAALQTATFQCDQTIIMRDQEYVK